MTAEDRIAIWRKAVGGATFAELGALADERRIHRGTMRAFLKKVERGQALSHSDLRLLYTQERARNDYAVAQAGLSARGGVEQEQPAP